MSSGDRLDWILSGTDSKQLADRYDRWAASYDDDHDALGWRGPQVALGALTTSVQPHSFNGRLLDAGCGTGRLGAVIATSDVDVELVGVDFSRGMLDRAVAGGHYDRLVQASLDDLPLDSASVDAVISTGVFTHGHAGGDALAELCRVTRPGGVIVLTRRVDIIDTYQPSIDQLCAAARWVEVERSLPLRLHPDHNEVEQLVISWRVLEGTAAPAQPDLKG